MEHISGARTNGRWMEAVAGSHGPGWSPARNAVLGILPGEGIGPEVVGAALKVLDAIEAVGPARLIRRVGGAIGNGAAGCRDGAVTEEVAAFCREIFEEGGAILSGPGGGRFVYDLRRRFDLFCKLAPLRPIRALHRTGPMKEGMLKGVDVLIVRDNAGGIYQGRWSMRRDGEKGSVAEHQFSYSESQVRQIVAVGARLARARRGRMEVVIKEGGVPTISQLWRETAARVAAEADVACGFINADFAAYELIRHPQRFDVLVTPNLIGDVLADLGAVFLGSRGVSFSGNFSTAGHAVYQTGHGAAHDLAGTDRANPVGQILSLAMMLRESYGLDREAEWVERAVEAAFAVGYRTDDVAEPGCRRVGTRRMGELIAEAVAEQVSARVPA